MSKFQTDLDEQFWDDLYEVMECEISESPKTHICEINIPSDDSEMAAILLSHKLIPFLTSKLIKVEDEEESETTY